MSTISNISLSEIRSQHAGKYIESFDAGCVYHPVNGRDVPCLDVIVWESEADSVDDDGASAVARYMIEA